MIDIIKILLGSLLLVIGHRFYWLFISAIGFTAGIFVAQYFLRFASDMNKLFIAVAAGILGVILAHFLEKFMVKIAGAFAGGYILTEMLDAFQMHSEFPSWLVFMIGAVLGFIFITKVLTWALIIFSSSIGSLLIAQSVPLPSGLFAMAFLIMFAAGIILQSHKQT